MKLPASLLTAPLLVALLAPPAAADAPADPVVAACVADYQATQELRLERHLLRARQRAAACGEETCPAAVRSGCTKWLREILDQQPSIAVIAREGDADVSDGEVFVDGAPAEGALSGRAVEVDPGPHVVRVVRRGRTLEQSVVVIEGVKSRLLTFELGAPPARSAPVAPPPAPARRGAPVAGIVAGGLGLGAMAAFAVLAISGTRDLARMRESCGQTHVCREDDIHAVKVKLVTGDAFLGASVAALGAAVGLTIHHFVRDPGPARLGLLLGPGRAGVTLAF
jgi:hypothetical protein